MHRKDCPNVLNKKERIIEVQWDDHHEHGEYEVVLRISSMDRNFLLTDLVTIASQLRVKMNAVNSEVDEDLVHVTTTMRVVVKDGQQLRILIANLRKVDSVLRVDRAVL